MQICLINKILAMIKDEIFSVNSDFSEFDLQQSFGYGWVIGFSG